MPSKEQSTGEQTYPALPLIGKWFETTTAGLKKSLQESHVNFITKFLVLIAHYLLYISAVCGFAIGVITYIQLDFKYARYLVLGIGFMLFLPTLQYMANKFLYSATTLLKNTPSQLSSTLVPRLISLISLVGSLILGIIYIFDGISHGYIQWLFLGITILISGWAIAVLALKPKSLYIAIKPETSAGAEALGILSLLVRILYKLIPLAFSFLVIFWSINLIIDLYRSLVEVNHFGIAEFAQDHGENLLIATALPIIAYLVFSIIYLSIDVLRAILSIRKDTE